MKYLNIGCGYKFICSEEWTNIDINSNHRCVINHNIVKGLPFDNNSFDIVYHSNILEHLNKLEAENLIKECYRILKKDGVLRIAVPDLEEIVKQYLFQLEKARDNDNNAVNNYDWIILELIDQMTRTKSGGLMSEYLNQENISNKEYIYNRIGEDGRNMIHYFEQNRNVRLNEKSSFSIFAHILKSIRFVSRLKYWKHVLLKLLLKENYSNYKIAQFRSSGEIHQWMYDSFSLNRLLTKSGFINIIRVSPFKSNIPDWNKYELDIKNDKVLKPDSLFMEGIK